MTDTIQFTVKAHVLKVNGRKCTLAVFKQLQSRSHIDPTCTRSYMDHSLLRVNPKAKALGWVHYQCRSDGHENHLIWTDGKQVFKSRFLKYLDGMEAMDSKLQDFEFWAENNQLFIGI